MGILKLLLLLLDRLALLYLIHSKIKDTISLKNDVYRLIDLIKHKVSKKTNKKQ